MTPLPEIRILDKIDQEEILQWLRDLRLKAYTPGSGYNVSAVFAMKRERDFVLAGGVNVECFDHRLSSHGETAAISLLATIFGRKIVLDEGWTLGAPKELTGPSADPLGDKTGTTCGACRQHINEFARNPQMIMSSVAMNGQREVYPLEVLLPASFSFNHFDPRVNSAKTAARSSDANLDLDEMRRRVVRYEALERKEIFDWLQSLESIEYASGLDHAVILRLSSGAYVAGVKVENAAYVGTSAMQSALANAVTTFGKIDVVEIFSRGRRREAATDLVYPLALSGLQGLNEFVTSDHKKVPVTLFAASGDSITIGLGQAASLPTGFAHPAYRLSEGRLSLAE
ncbi:MAG: hypothetical protein JWO78_507 [Micavibrio sp.]|nr:hypothetical protein [Micavibrio sp.]